MAIRLPPLNSLRAFEASARHLNFRLAAEELGVTQGAVAQQVRKLEAYLGLHLFSRQSRALALTEPGRAYAANLRKAFDLIGASTATLRPEPTHLTISVTPTFATKWLIPRLAAFTATHPRIDLRILASERVADFQTDAVDIAIRNGRPPFGPGLKATLLFEQDTIAVASPAVAARLHTAADDLTLLHDSHDLWPQFLDLALPGPAPAARRNLRFNQTALAIDAALAGQGLALADRFLVADRIAEGRLIQVFAACLRTGVDFYVIHPRKPRRGSAVDTVRDWLVSQTQA